MHSCTWTRVLVHVDQGPRSCTWTRVLDCARGPGSSCTWTRVLVHVDQGSRARGPGFSCTWARVLVHVDQGCGSVHVDYAGVSDLVHFIAQKHCFCLLSSSPASPRIFPPQTTPNSNLFSMQNAIVYLTCGSSHQV